MPMENFKFAENVAHFLILNRTDGGKRYVILPMMQPSRLKTRKLSICVRYVSGIHILFCNVFIDNIMIIKLHSN